MPVVLPAVIAGAIAATSVSAAGAVAFSFGTFLLATAGTLVLGQISKALAPKPKKPNYARFDAGHTQSLRQAVTTRKHIYGQMRVSGPYAYFGTTGNNEYFHLVILLAAHKIASIDEIWVNDYVIPNDWLDSNGNVTQGRYANYMRIRKHLGHSGQAADAAMVAEIPDWTANHRLQGIAYIYVRLRFSPDLYPGGLPNLSAVVRGKELFDPRDGGTRWSTNLALAWHDLMRSSEYGYGADEGRFTAGNVAGAASVSDEIVGAPALDAEIAGINLASNIITLKTSSARLPYQVGDRVELMTTGTPPGGLAVETDYYVIPYQFKDTPRLLLASSLAHAMAGTAIDITSAGTGTHTLRRTGEPRYHGAYLLDTANVLKDSIEDILRGMAGRAVHAGGKWRLNPAIWTEPTQTFGIGDFTGPMNLSRGGDSEDERFNAVKGVYISSIFDFQPTDYPMVRSQAFIDQDGGVEEIRDISMPSTNRVTAAQRIAKIELFRARQDIAFSVQLNLKGLLVQAGDNAMLTIDRFGWDEKAFEVTGFTLSNNGDSDAPRLVTELSFRETAAAIFDWQSDEASEVDPAPNTNLPNPFDIAPPTGLSFSSRAVGTRDGDVVYSLVLAWAAHDDAYVRGGGRFEVQYRKSGDDDWRPSFFVSGDQNFSDVLTSSVNTKYDLRVRAVNNLGVRSNWSQINNAIVGSSGGVSATEDWGDFMTTPSATQDWGDFTTSPSATQDWGYFT